MLTGQDIASLFTTTDELEKRKKKKGLTSTEPTLTLPSGYTLETMQPMRGIKDLEKTETPIGLEKGEKYEYGGELKEELGAEKRGFLPRQAEVATQKAKEIDIQLSKVAKAMESRLKMLAVESDALVKGYTIDPNTGQKIVLSENDMQQIAEDLIPEITKWNLYSHTLPIATRGLGNYWIPKIKARLGKFMHKHPTFETGREKLLREAFPEKYMKKGTTTKMPADIGLRRTKIYDNTLRELVGTEKIVRGEVPTWAKYGAERWSKFMDHYLGKLDFKVGEYRFLQSQAPEIIKNISKLSKEFDVAWKIFENGVSKSLSAMTKAGIPVTGETLLTAISQTTSFVAGITSTPKYDITPTGKLTESLKPSEYITPTEKPGGEPDVPTFLKRDVTKKPIDVKKKLFPSDIAEKVSQVKRAPLPTDVPTEREVYEVKQIQELSNAGYSPQQIDALLGTRLSEGMTPSKGLYPEEQRVPLPKDIEPVAPKTVSSLFEKSLISTEATGEVAESIEPTAPEEIGRPPETMGGLPYESLKPEDLPQKIYSLYGQARAKGVELSKIMEERTILKLIEKGETQIARERFEAGKKQGIVEQRIKFEDYVKRLRERKILRGRVEKARKQIFKVDLKHMEKKFADPIKTIQSQLDPSKPRTGTLYSLQQTANYLRNMAKEGHEHTVPESRLKEIERLSKTPIQDLTVEEVENIARIVQHYVHLQNLKNTLKVGIKRLQFNKVKDEVLQNLQKSVKKDVGDPAVIDMGVKEVHAGKLKQLWSTDVDNLELLCDRLDGTIGTETTSETKHGIIQQSIFEPLNQGVKDQLSYEWDAYDWIANEFEKAGIDNRSLHNLSRAIGGKTAKTHTVEITEGRKITNITGAERIGLIMHSFNKNNLRHLIQGGFSPEWNRFKKYTINLEDLKMIINSATPQEKAIVKIFLKFMNQVAQPKLNQKSIEIDGFERFLEENYWTIRVNSLDRKIENKEFLSRPLAEQVLTIEGMGIFKPRLGTSEAIILEDAFTTFFKHVKRTSAYYGLASPLRDVKKLVYDKNFRNTLQGTRGYAYWKAIENAVADIEGRSHDTTNVEKLTTYLINQLDLAILGLNLGVMFKQPVSYVVALTELDTRDWFKGVLTKRNKGEVMQHSIELRDRFEGGKVSRELGELGQVGSVRKFFTGQSPHSHKFVGGMRAFDTQTICTIWNAVKAETSRLYPALQKESKVYWDHVAKRAEEVVRITQLSFEMKERGRIARSPNVFLRLLTKYSSQRVKNYMMLKRSWIKYKNSPRGAKDKAKLFKNMMLITVVSSALIEGVNQARGRLLGKKPKTLAETAVSTIGNTLSYAYFLGTGFDAIISEMKRGVYRGYGISDPVRSYFMDWVHLFGRFEDVIGQALADEEYKKKPEKPLTILGKKIYHGEKKFIYTAGKATDLLIKQLLFLKGIPYATLKHYFEATKGFVTGEEKYLHPEKYYTPKKPEKPKKKGNLTGRDVSDLFGD